MNPNWLKITFPIALLFSFRMLGLFMLIPVFTLYAPHLKSATPMLIGVALGAYGLSQGLLQIPFGIWSDRYGRKPLIRIGLFLFIIGSLLGALSDSIYVMIIARVLQGAGAIGSVLIALLSDLTDESVRTKSMAIIGMTIGVSFAIAIILSPVITQWSGLKGVFYFTTVLGLTGLVVLHYFIPNSALTPSPHSTEKGYFLAVLRTPHLWPLNIGIFGQHFILTASFFVIPLILKNAIDNNVINATWPLYLGWMLISFITMVPLIIIGEKKKQMPVLFSAAIITIILTEGVIAFTFNQTPLLIIAVLFYFIAFNFLEAALPSFVSKMAPKDKKGTAMGIYSTCQFLGIFFGGTLSGIVFSYFDVQGVFIMNSLIGILWFGVQRHINA